MRHLATIGLGANLPSSAGSPAQTLVSAIEDLSRIGRLVAQSALYRTEPLGYEAQPAFVNAVLQLETELDPRGLLQWLLATERRYGRDRSHGVPNGPRTLDLDLLLFDDRVIETPELQLPHPAMAERRFVLEPLCEIAGELRHPISGASMKELLAALPDEETNRRAAVQRIKDLPEHS